MPGKAETDNRHKHNGDKHMARPNPVLMALNQEKAELDARIAELRGKLELIEAMLDKAGKLASATRKPRKAKPAVSTPPTP